MTRCRAEYDGPVLRGLTEYVRARLTERGELIPLGFSWAFVITIDVSLACIAVVATLQRPVSDLPAALTAAVIAISPPVMFFVWAIKLKSVVLWATSTIAAAIFLFATATPVSSDYAPLLLVLMVGSVGSLSPTLGGIGAAGSAVALLVAAGVSGRLDDLELYLPILGMGWLVGFLMRVQQQLMIKQEQARAALAEHAAADERRRIAREVHDVIAHSLSITLLHLTGARRGLEVDGDIDEAVDALRQAEHLGRQAMGDIRRTVGLLDAGPMRTAPEPGVDDITALVAEFSNAGLDVELATSGQTGEVPASAGLALYRIAQESLANIAKHAPTSKSTVQLVISRRSADLSVINRLPAPVGSAGSGAGRGVVGMRQRIALLDGAIEVGPTDDEWRVHASIPLDDVALFRPPWCKG